ncbi:MAG: hypothetical protein GY755_10505, partial [Chloroflexi bacterium]|nr:hypothetical protein [Chloroflexota bacterium]
YRNATTNKESHIDLTLASNNVDIDNWQSIKHPYHKQFDHYLLRYDINLSEAAGFNMRRKSWNLNSKNWNYFTICTDKCINKLNQFIAHRTKNIENNLNNPDKIRYEINTLNDEITHAIINTANSTIGKKTFYVGYNPWWNKEIKTQRKIVDKLMKKLKKIEANFRKNIHWKQNYHRVELFPDWITTNIKRKKARNKKTSLIRAAKRKYIREINNLLQHPHLHTKKLWKIVNSKQFRNEITIPPIFIDKDSNSTANHPTIKATLIHAPTKNPPQPTFTADHLLHHQQITDEIEEIINENEFNYQDLDPDPQSTLNSVIYTYEIKNCIAALEKQKAIGEDEIHNLMLKNLSHKFIKNILVKLFNLCLKFHIFPEIWNKANIIPIPKPNKDHRYAENYRPIAISSCFGKLYERIL